MSEVHINAQPSPAAVGSPVKLEVVHGEHPSDYTYTWTVVHEEHTDKPLPTTGSGPTVLVTPALHGKHKVTVTVAKAGNPDSARKGHGTFDVETASVEMASDPFGGEGLAVSLSRANVVKTDDLVLWGLISHGTQAISFPKYKRFIDSVMCGGAAEIKDKVVNFDSEPKTPREFRSSLPFPGVDPYNLLKTATEVFMMGEMAVKSDLSEIDLDPELWRLTIRLGEKFSRDQANALLQKYLVHFHQPGMPGEVRTLPYLKLIADRLPEVGIKPAIGGRDEAENCYGILREKLRNPCMIELIWSYWHEEGMLVQAMNAISLRFQNRRSNGSTDALGRLDIDALRPLGNLFWGYIQDEQHRLTVLRRAYEYDHQYGLTLVGKAVRNFRPADSRSKFLEGFHNLLAKTAQFYLQDDDTTFIADGYPLLNAIREVHLVLAEGAHNQFGDLPTTARQEMLMQQWLLARPEMREFLGGRIMVPYPEPWMDRVDTVKKLSGWTDTVVTHFYELAVYGERLLLSIRWGNWSNVNYTGNQAANWARYWRPEIQGYLHAYRAATGVDLAPSQAQFQNPSEAYGVQPSILLQKRLALQSRTH